MGGNTSTPATGKLSSSAQSTQQPVGTNPAQTNSYVGAPMGYGTATGKLSNSAPMMQQPAFNYFPSAHVTGPTDPRQITNFTDPINRAPLVHVPTAAEVALQNMASNFGGYGGFGGFGNLNSSFNTMGYAGGGKVDGDHHERMLRLAHEILLKRGE